MGSIIYTIIHLEYLRYIMESKEFSARVIQGGRITIPEHVRIDLHIKTGDRVKIILQKPLSLKGNIII
jgi:AbrB family looped-hinge helix DNA binding protein